MPILSVCLPGQETPKLRLPETVSPTGYRAQLSLDPHKADFAGSIAIQITVKQPTKIIWLNATDLKVSEASVVARNKTLTAQAIPEGTDFLKLQLEEELPAGSAEVRIRYSGRVRQQDSSGVFHMEDNGNQYLFTQFESTDARDVFPCFDEPSYKVPWQLTLSVPEGDSAVSNTSPSKESTEGDRKVYTFAETKPLPSYLVAFAVGPLEYVDAGKAGRNQIPVRIVTPKGHRDEAKYAAEITSTIITRLENYFAIPFPYDKSDQVAIPTTFGFGAMENAGMVTYAQTILLAKPDRDTVRRQREYASVAAHELAHQWFGDLVTTGWWNDIWLNEAFATWMEQKLIADWKPEWKTRIEDVDSKIHAQEEDSLISSRKIRQEIVSKDDISNAFDSITYLKGGAVIRMFENYMGTDNFRKGVQQYLKQYAFRNATAPEFLDAVSSGGGKNISQAFSTFLNQPGVPLVSARLDCQGTPALHLEQTRSLPLGSKGSASQTWQIPVCVRYGSGDTGQSECTLLTEAQTDWKLKASGCPAWLQANDSGAGYYRVDYQGGLLSALTKGDAGRRLSGPERVDLMGNARALTDSGKLPMADALALVPIFANDENHQVVVSALTLALEPSNHLVPPDLEPSYRRFLEQTFDTRARRLGWTPKAGESEDDRLLRPYLLQAAATVGGDKKLAQEAQELTQRWFEDHSAIDPNLTVAALGTAAYYADKPLAEKFLAEFQKTKDRQERGRLIRAMGSFRNPAAIEAAMDAVLHGQVPFIEGDSLLFAGSEFPATRKLPFEFLKTHFDEISAKRPTGGGFDAGSLFPRVGQSYCDASSRDELESFFQPKVSQFTGAPRALKQVVEGINLCIAQKAEQEASVAAFLKRY